MLEQLEKLDQELFLYLNEQQSPFWDNVMVTVSDKYFWIPFYLLLIGYIIWRYKLQSIPMLLMAVAGIGLADYVASGIFKPYFARLRPCHDPEISAMVNLVRGCGGQFGFLSSHASTGFALAVFFNLTLSDRYLIFKILLVTWAVMVSYSRIYLGVHYPGDTLGGALVGTGTAMLAVVGYRFWLRKYTRFQHKPLA
ncbi:phosphatase PAP2 family protein [Pontibacter sp. BAB1700]|uniref:phosphatase PAP2 family protein n=1 Tax=Pontibacter sp. BAB1700 TaxID=1144253 RepID=UPI00026BCD21|nr:phosphatase PAP2 family protein [Pontibacter sp. BAB1700]EJF11628.1 PA-phosphatase-like phosphoesterase [Pontibacter sp. BAB1700]